MSDDEQPARRSHLHRVGPPDQLRRQRVIPAPRALRGETLMRQWPPPGEPTGQRVIPDVPAPIRGETLMRHRPPHDDEP